MSQIKDSLKLCAVIVSGIFWYIHLLLKKISADRANHNTAYFFSIFYLTLIVKYIKIFNRFLLICDNLEA
jgi:hypothetical protein